MGKHMSGTITELWRYPVKSMLGEQCESLHFGSRGIQGDRQFAIRNASGKFGSGKNTRRFTKIDGLLTFRTSYKGDVPEVHFPSGEVIRGDSPHINTALSAILGQPVVLSEEADVSHLDAGPVHLITSASIDWLQSALPEATISTARFRPNVVLQVPGTGLVEEAWIGKQIRLGDEVRLLISAQTVRCGMVAFAQGDLALAPEVLRQITQHAETKFGVYAHVIEPGIVRVGDKMILEE
jgi:uncharacterized protein